MLREHVRGLAARVAVVIWLGSGVAASPALAQDAEAAARASFTQGVEAARAERWPEAYDAFNEAYATLPRPAVLLNLANAQAHTGRLLEAEASYARFLRETQGDRNMAAHRRAAEEAIDVVRLGIPRLQISVTAPRQGDTLEVDGEPVSPEDAASGVPVNPGDHEVTLVRGGTVAAWARAELAEGDSRVVELTASVTAADAQLPDEEPGLLDVDSSDADGSSPWASPWLWGAVGVVVVGALTAIIVVAVSGESDPISGNVGPGVTGVR